jgi:hypothetical protein
MQRELKTRIGLRATWGVHSIRITKIDKQVNPECFVLFTTLQMQKCYVLSFFCICSSAGFSVVCSVDNKCRMLFLAKLSVVFRVVKCRAANKYGLFLDTHSTLKSTFKRRCFLWKRH